MQLDKNNRKKKRKARISVVLEKIQVSKDYHWKLLDALCLDLKGYITDDDYALMSQIIRNRDLHAYHCLGDIWSLRCMASDCVPSTFSLWKSRYTIASFLSKYLPSPDETLDAVALKKFLQSEDVCRSYNNNEICYLTESEDSFTKFIFTKVKYFLRKVLGDEVPIKDIVKESSHGPGANLDTCNGLTDEYFKYSRWPYSCTTEAYSYARYMIRKDEHWYHALRESYRVANRLGLQQDIDERDFWRQVIRFENYNRVTFVPKNAKTSRSIAIEPALNLMLQLGTNKVLSKKLKRFGIDLNSQELNRLFSRIGSKDGLFSTLDLQGASDSISLSLCKAVLPEDWYSFLYKLRCPNGLLNDETLIYEKISSMGNGFTFALESAIFAAFIYAAYLYYGIKPSFGNNALVFGDDLIVRTPAVPLVIKALKLGGFSLNLDKTFTSGYVRESCGSDWFKGLPVRPIFLHEPPCTVQNLFNDYNRIKRFLNLRFGITDSNCCKTIEKWFPKGHYFYGPYSDEVFDSWVHTDVPGAYSNGLYKFPRLIKFSTSYKMPKFLLYGHWNFVKLKIHYGKREPEHFYRPGKSSRIRAPKGSHFTVLAKGYTVKAKPSVVSNWTTVYTEVLPVQ